MSTQEIARAQDQRAPPFGGGVLQHLLHLDAHLALAADRVLRAAFVDEGALGRLKL
ncbi:MAG: hypothetical protein IIA02_15720 [Proteobacteria bacterium]|uniref:hypothetical protein n=1 Tax=Aquabacterium sp. TaxID=1872578 RepID=UPI0035C73FAB|nr:hypothetical protein [Pseudomonadota bacterium]